MKTLLVSPPITDPTSGYHSLCYLETYARQQGFEHIDIVDVNIEALLFTMRPNQFAWIQSHCMERKDKLAVQSALNGMEQIELHHLWRVAGMDEESLRFSVEVMRDPELFFDYRHYRFASEILLRWLDILSVFGYPGQFIGFSLPVRHMFNLLSSRDMSDHEVCAKIAAPFQGYVRDELLRQIEDNQYQVVGLNVTYCAQLPFALAIARQVREKFPNIRILFGGTEVADVWKYLTHKSRFFSIFDAADACVVGEGEVAFTELLRRVQEGDPFASPISNVLFHPKYGDESIGPDIQYFPIADLPAPDYSKLPWEKYLSPNSYVYYSPSRGCYWNKCTFCDYGLNSDSPTSPWRQNTVDKVFSDLKRINAQGHKHVYFSVDVLAPALLLNLSEKIVTSTEEERPDVRWGAEIRLETYWSPERCQTLKQAGCMDISVGYESGSQRILDLIDKGTKVERIRETMQNFAQANIGVQMMGFTGFPTETFDEAMESVRFLKESRDDWTFGGLGNFVLTPGAIVAKEPERFQISDVRPYANEDIVRNLAYINLSGELSSEQTNQLQKAKGELSKHHFNRPFVGGIDTAHTMFYHEHFGRNILAALCPYETKLIGDQLDEVWVLNGRIADDLDGYQVSSLFSEARLKEWHNQSLAEKSGLDSSSLHERLAQERLESGLSEGKKRRYFIRTDAAVYPFPQEMLEFLGWFEDGQTLQNYLDQAPEADHPSIKKLHAHSVRHHFLRGAFTEREVRQLSSYDEIFAERV